MQIIDDDSEMTPKGGGAELVHPSTSKDLGTLTIEQLQNIYHKITGKSEQLSKSYSDAFQISLADLEQLHMKILQTYGQYTCQAENHDITVFYADDTKEVFSSFDRFKSFNAGNTSPVESILLTYNTMIIPPKVGELQSYTIRVRILSRLTIQNKMQRGLPFNIPKLYAMLHSQTAVASISWVDYVIARNLMVTLDSWFSGLHRYESSSVWKWITKHSNYLPLICRYITGGIVSFLILRAIPEFLDANSAIIDFAYFSFIAYIGLFASYRFAHHMGSIAEDSLDRWSEPSYINITAGDARAIQACKKQNFASIICTCVKIVVSQLASIAAKMAIVYLGRA